MRGPAPLLVALVALPVVGCGGAIGPAPEIELDLQGHRGLERSGDDWTRVFRSGESPVLLARPTADPGPDETLRLATWVVAAAVGEAEEAWSLWWPAEQGGDEGDGFVTREGVHVAVVSPDQLGVEEDAPATLVFAAWWAGDRGAERFVVRNAGSAPTEWHTGVAWRSFPLRLASRGARAAAASEAVAACRRAYDEEPQRVPELCAEAAATGGARDRMLALERLGLHLRREGRLDEARERFEQAADAASEAELPGDQTTDLRLAALCCREAGDLSSARELALQALAVDTTHGHLLWLARDHTTLGQVTHRLGEPGQAVDHLRQAGTLTRLLDRPYDEANALVDLAMVYRGLGRYRHALATLDLARPLLEPSADATDHDREAWATYLGNRGWTLLRARRRGLLPATSKELEDAFSTALRVHREAGRVLWEANELMNLATLALQDGDPAAARSRLTEARTLLGGDASFEHAGYLLALEGELALVEEEPGLAMEAFDALQGVEGRWSARWWADYGRARAHAAAGRPAAADVAFEQALEALEGAAAALDPLVDRAYFLGDRDEVYDRYLLHLLEQGRVAEALAVSERSRSRADRRARGLGEAALAESDRPLLDEVIAARNELRRHEADEAFLRSGQRDDWQAERRARIERLVEAQAALVAAERAEWTPAHPPEDGDLDVTATMSALPAGARLLLYHATVDELILFVVSGAGVRAHRIAIGRLPLEQRVDALRTAVGTGGGQAEGEALGRLLFPSDLTLDREQLLVFAPHGPLHGLSFPLVRRHERYLIEDHPLAVVPSARSLALSVSGPACVDGGAVVMADPAGDLPGAREEGRQVAASRPGAELLLGEEVDGAAVRGALTRACSFHFAGHAVLDPDLPQHSHLRLAGGEKLTWIDLQALAVHPRLVVLSACETGRGMTPAAGERWGLASGFLAAGASSVVASGWKVPDEPSRALIERFYGELDAAGPAEALRRAQRSLLSGEAGPIAADPGAWGAFSMFGDPAPIAAPAPG